VSYVLEQMDGSGSQQTNRAITGYGAPGSGIVNHTSTTVNTVGRCVYLNGTATNDGPYSIVARTPDNLSSTLTPIPNVDPVAGSMFVLQQGAQKVAPQTLVGATFTNPDTISGLPTDFDAALVNKNDRVLISGSTSNDGAWFVKAHPTIVGTLLVRPLNGGANIVSELGAGTIEVRVGTHRVRALDESTPSWSSLFSTGTVHATRGSGTIADYRLNESRSINEGNVECYLLLGIGAVQFDFSAGGQVDWTMLDTLVVNATNLGGVVPMVPGVGSTGLNSFEIGSDGGGVERAAAEEGCALVGPTVGIGLAVVGSGGNATNQVTKSYGSAWWPTLGMAGVNDAVWVSSFVRNSLTQPGALGGTGGFIESVIQYGGDGVASLGAGLDARNILVAQSDSSATLANITSATIEGVLLSDLSFLARRLHGRRAV
jgi:hypothetical protein